MKYTNIHNLPEALVNLIKHDDYPVHDQSGKMKISVTGLLAPPRITQLRMRHKDEIIVDVADLMWAAFGKSMHNSLYQANTSDIAEERLEVEIDDVIITGQFDLLKSAKPVMVDYKVTSVYSAMKQDTLMKWSDQINYYYYLAHANGLQVEDAQVVAFLRDWGPRHKMEKGMPNIPIQCVGIDLRDLTVIENHMRERIALHKLAASLTDDQLPICSREDQWRSDDVYKIRKEGRKTSVRNLPTIAKALAYAKKEKLFIDDHWKKGYSLEYVKGHPRRCEDYCEVNIFCSQYKQEHHDESSDNVPAESNQGATA